MRLLAAILLACATTTVAQAEGRPFTVEDLLSLEDTGHAAFSPDERWLAFETFAPWKAAARFDRDFLVQQGLGRLFVVDLAGSAPPRPLITPAPGAGDTLGDFSPAGDKVIVYRLKDRRRELGIVTAASGAVVWTGVHVDPEVWTAAALWRSAKEIVVLTKSPEAASVLLGRGWQTQARTETAWAASAGGKLAVTTLGAGRYAGMNPPAPDMTLVVIDAETGVARSVASGPFSDFSLAPGGQAVAIQTEEEAVLPDAATVLGPDPERRRRLVMVDILTGAVSRPCPRCDLLLSSTAWSPDGAAFVAPARQDGEAWSAARYWRFSIDGQAKLASSQVQVGVAGWRQRPPAGVAWTGRGPIVLGRTTAAPRLDWWRLTAKGPVNLTAGSSGGVAQSPARGRDSALLQTADGFLAVAGDGPGRSISASALAPTAPLLAGRAPVAVVVRGKTGAQLVGAGGAIKPIPDLGDRTRVLAIGARSGRLMVESRDPHGVRTLKLVAPSSEVTDLATLNAPLASVAFAAPRAIRHRGGGDAELTSWLYMPPGRETDPDLPVIVVPYPGSAYSRPPEDEQPGEIKFDTNIQLMTAAGYAVIVPSLPIPADTEPAPGLAEAMLAIVEAARAQQPNLSATRLAVWGQSYGGYGALLAGAQSDRFRAVVATAPVTNLISRHAPLPALAINVPEVALQLPGRLTWAETGQGRMGAPPWKDPDRYIRNSPLFQVERFTAPVMLVVGDLDSDPGQVHAMFASLHRLGKDAQLLEYRGEAHVIISPDNVRDLYARAFRFLGEALGSTPDVKVKPEAIRASQ